MADVDHHQQDHMDDTKALKADKNKTNKILFMEKNLFYKILSKISLIFFGYIICYMSWSIWLPMITIASLIWLKDYDNNKNERIRLRAAACSTTKQEVYRKIDEIPSWVMFPDRERAEWLNQMITQLWPTINTFIVKKFKSSIEPKIRRKHDGFRFENVDFGSTPPKIDGIKVYDCAKTKDSIIIDFDVFYDGNCDINFSLSGAQIGGIRDFQLSVEVRVVLKPLLAKMPLIGGVQIFFLNTPDINFILEGISSIPGFSTFIRTKIEEKLMKKIVYPNKITKRFSKSVEAVELKALEPAGVLRVHVSEAKNLIGKDITGKSDPYVILHVGAQQERTPTVQQNLNPKWDYWCEFVILDPMSQHISFKVFDHDNVNEDDFLGSGDVDISSVIRGQTDQWLDLQNVKHGKIHLRFTWLSLSADYNNFEKAIEETKLLKIDRISTAVLIVYVDSAQNLPAPKPFKKPHVYFTANINNYKQKSRVKRFTTDPVWEQGFVFLVNNPEYDIFHINFEDKETDTILDQFNYRIKDLKHHPDLEFSKQEFTINDTNQTRLILSLQLRILTNELFQQDEDSESDSETSFSRQNSNRSDRSEHAEKSNSGNGIQEEKLIKTNLTMAQQKPRQSSTTTLQGEHRLGRIEVTLEYSEMRQKLLVTIHRIANLPLKDPSDIPDPYVKIKLIPAGNHLKYKTKVKMDNCDPIYEETFEYLLSKPEIYEQKLELTIKTFKKLFFNRNTIGQVFINLQYIDIREPHRAWYDICHEQSNN